MHCNISIDRVAMILNGVALPPVAVLNNPDIPSSSVVMCVGTEGNRQLELRFSNVPLPNPVVAGVYRSQFDSTTFNVASYDNTVLVNVNNVGELPSFESFNCTSLESSAAAKLFVTNGELKGISASVHIQVYMMVITRPDFTT